ncbi:MAG: YraN family protein [Rhodobacteraceae bacterium]|nr:YraN family protein [Paracoccaceae bacterium]
MSGRLSYHGGCAAEDQVAAHYRVQGMTIAASRWRGQSGEIDLIARNGDAVVFVEVKRARNFAIAAERLTSRQMARIYGAASEFVAKEPAGQDTEMRFDVALVDGAGRIEIIDNAIFH